MMDVEPAALGDACPEVIDNLQDRRQQLLGLAIGERSCLDLDLSPLNALVDGFSA